MLDHNHMPDIRMIVTDLDRTLLRSDKTISKYTQGVLRACRARGALLAFATGRSEGQSKRATDIIETDALISNDGALARAGDTIVHLAELDARVADRLMAVCSGNPYVGYIAADTQNGYYVNKPVDENDPNWTEFLPAICADMRQGLGINTYKVTVEISDARAARAIMSEFPDLDVIAYYGENWYRFANKNAGKWNALYALADYFGVDIKNIAAFGDDTNDIDMLRHCGYGVAVEDAADEARAAAAYTCKNSDADGVARWLAAHINI